VTAARRGIAIPVIFAVAAFCMFTGLGAWQIERKAWKEALIADLTQRLAAEPQALPPPERWPSLDPATDEFRRVVFAATIAPDREALVYAVGSTVRSDVTGPGYWVFAPAELAGGATVVLNRGFVPEGQQGTDTHAPVDGRLPVVGVLRWPEPRGLFFPKDDPARNLWFVRDHRAIASAKGWGAVAPFYVELETPTSRGQLPRAGRLNASLRNDHLQYALTWFALAVIVAIAFPLWVRSRRREASQGATDAT
jgi:cytochrome oxidase assembly protein ShyY1